MQNNDTPAEGNDSAKLEAESALRGAACSESLIVEIERHTEAVPCTCGGYCDNVDSTDEECQKYGCGSDKPGHECCAASFVCRICKKRYAGPRPAPEMD